jgi:membrane protease YdiL (CAAX protease family)
VSPSWWAFLILGVPAIYLAGAALGDGLGDWRLPEGLVGAVLFMLVLSPVEEFGWRGFMLPLLQRWMAPLWAGLVVPSGSNWKRGWSSPCSPGRARSPDRSR